MSEPFSLIKDKFSEEYNERWWTYSLHFNLLFNKRVINYITITDHTWKKPGREKITKGLILSIFQTKINGEVLTPEPKKNPNWKREHYALKRVPFKGRKYKLIFWFKDGTDNHLWIKNCHQQD